MFGVLGKRPNRFAGEVTLYIGISLGVVRLILENVELIYGRDLGAFFGFFTQIHFMYFAMAQFLISSITLFTVTCITSRFVHEIEKPTTSVANAPDERENFFWSHNLRTKLKHRSNLRGNDTTSREIEEDLLAPREEQNSSSEKTAQEGDCCFLISSRCPTLSLPHQKVEVIIKMLLLAVITCWIVVICSIELIW